MVFESVVTDVLNKLLGDYVENLDKKQLKIGIWGGDVVLNNLKLRENALDDLNLPVQLVYGFLGKLVLKIPWKNLYGQPVVAQIEDLYILVSPKQSVEYNAEKEEKYEMQVKQTALLALDEAFKKELDKDKPKPDASFTEKLTAQIVNNLQVMIANVHIRYEDTTTTGKPFAFGVTLHELEICTTDVNWVKCYLAEQVSRVYKIAKLDCLSVYMNCNGELFSLRSTEELSNMFRSNIARREILPLGYNYIVGPITSTAKLRLNMNPEYDDPAFVIPKIDLCLEMEKLNIGLTSTQFQNVLNLGDSMNRMQLGAPYRKYRPFNIPYKNHYKEWWKFAITSILEENIKKKNRCWTWEYIAKHRQLCTTYAETLRERNVCKKPSANLIATCTLLEQKLDLFNLILIRQRNQLTAQKIKQEEEEKKTTEKAGGWFGGWFGGGQKDENEEPSDIAKKFEAAMNKDEKDKLYKAIGYQENAVPLDIPEHYEAIIMNFKLIALEIGLYDDTKEQLNQEFSTTSIDFESLQTIMLLKFSMATCSVQQRPAASALSITAGMKEMHLTGLKKTKAAIAPTLIESKVTDEFNLLDLFFETNPLDKKCDQRIKVHARPLQIVYDSDTILNLIKVFSPPKSVNLSELEGAASARVANFKERSATGMQYVIENHSVIEVDIKFMPNILIVPNNGIYIPGRSSMVVVSLGKLHITSKPHETAFGGSVATQYAAGMAQEEILHGIMEKAYDKYKICIDDVQVLVVKPKERWEDVLLMAAQSELHVLHPTSLIIKADLCVIGDDPRMPKTKVDIELPSIQINLTEDRIFEALNVLTSIPLPEGDTLEPAPLLRAVSSASMRLSVINFLNYEKKVKANRAKASEAIATEIVQYTNLELSFALKEISITLYKSSCLSDEKCFDESPTESDNFGTPIEDMPSATGIEEFLDSASHIDVESAPPAAQKIMTFQILQLEANMAQRTYELVASARLGAINLTQYDNRINKDEESICVVDTPRFSGEQKYLLTVSYTMANKTSPEFITKYNSTEQLIVVKFSTLNVTLHQEYLLRLMELANTLQQRLDAVNKSDGQPKDRIGSAGDASIINKLTTIMEEDSEENIIAAPIQGKRTRSTKVVESIKINVVAHLEQVGLLLTCRKRPLATLKVQNFDASVILKSSYTEVTLRLKDIIVTDLNPHNIHSSILSIVGNDAFNCQVVLYNLDETSNYNSDDMKVNVEIGCLKIVFLNWFVTSVLSFLSNFQEAQQAVANASAAAADAAKQNAIDVYEKATRMKLNIKIKAPIIVVPIHSQSLHAIVLDLGYLMLSNVISEVNVPDQEKSPAVIDEINLQMKDMKLSKCSIISAGLEESSGITLDSSIDTIDLAFGFKSNANMFDTVDLAYGLKSNVNILDPISFTLVVKRNLSSSWYHELPDIDLSGRLKSIELNLFMEDYALIMSILNRNLTEGQDEFATVNKSKPPPQATTTADVYKKLDHASVPSSPSNRQSTKKSKSVAKNENIKVYEQMKFNFQFDGVIVNLMLANNDGLARFGLYFLSLKGNQLVDGTLSTSIVLCNIQIDDTRPNTKSKITKYLCRKDWKSKDIQQKSIGSNLEVCTNERNFMLDLTAIIKENDTFAEVRVSGFDLILCIDFLLQLANFFKLPEEAAADDAEVPKNITDQKTIPKARGAQKGTPSTPTVVAKTENVNKMNLVLHIEEPDIILIESLEDINTNAIIFNAQAQLNYRVLGEKQLINGQIDALKMYMCSFMPERREATKHYIIHPCVISLQGSTPEEEGLHISLKLSEIIINVSPATIELMNKAMLTISAGSAEMAAEQNNEVNYNELWNAKRFKENDFWFIKVDEAEDALQVIENSLAVVKQKTEKCIVEVPSITLVVETGVGYYTMPLIAIDTKLDAVVSDWSRKMSIKGSLCLNMNYYNQALAIWEPLIELNERSNKQGIKSYLPWELSFGLQIESKPSEFDETVEEQTTQIKIESEEMLEITMSKTCLDMLGVLGEAFSQAIDAKGLTKPDVIAPYVVENDTGFDISINFRRGIFTLHECHMPKASTTNTLNRSLLFQTEEAEANFTPEQVKDCKISAGGRAYLQTKDLSTVTCEEDEEYNLYVKIGEINKEVEIPVSKSDQRFFPLFRDTNQEPWGILSEVCSEFGTTKINIHGVVNVCNHFTASIHIYRKKPNSQEKVIVGEVAPGEMFHVPLHAIYAENKELYFSLDGYNVSVQGIKWNDSPTDLAYSRQIQCDPVATFEPLYINAVRQKKEVFFENTNKFKLLSAFYTIHLRPPLYMRNALPINISVSVAGCSVRQNMEAKPAEVDLSPSIINEDLLDYGEKQVNPGDVLHLPTVKMSGKSKEGKSYLVVRLIQYLEKDWSCTTEISAENLETVTWTFTSYDSAAKMDMDLCVRFLDRYGSLEVTIFSPFWMINKTGQMLSYKTDTETVDVLYHPPEYKGPILFSFRDKFFFDKKRASIRVDNGDWSDKIPLDVAGSMGAVTCVANETSYEIGVHNHLTQNSLTKQITFIPFFIATNKCDFPISLQDQSRPADPWTDVEPNACVPLWPKNESSHMIIAKVNGQCTVAFNYSEVQCTLLELKNNEYGGINVDVEATEGGVYISFTAYNPGDAPGLLINHSTKPVTYVEKGTMSVYILQPRHKIFYTWANPAGEKTLVFGNNAAESDLRRDGVGELMLTKTAKGYWVSFLDGLQRVLLFTEIEAIATKSESSSTLLSVTQSIEVRIHGIGLSVVNNVTGVDILYLGITCSGIIWEAKKENKKRFKQMNIYDTQIVEAQYQQYLLDTSVNQMKTYSIDGKYPIDFENMTLKKSSNRNIQRTFYPGVWILMQTSPFQTQLHAKINKIQIDNQLTDCIFPVVLAPIRPPKSVAATTAFKPFIECSMVQRVVPNSTVKQFKYASILIQEFHFKVDLLFLTAIAEMFIAAANDEHAAKLFSEDVKYIEMPLSNLVETHSMQEQKNFYDNLHLGPLKIHVSFSMAGSDTTALPGILSTLVQGVGVTLTDVNDVVFRLAFFEREYRFFTQRQLTSEITAHYAGQALKQLYVLVLGLDVLGNPYGLVVGLKKGVEDLFYEPFQGAIQGPGEFAEGVVLGVKSLFGHTVGGAAGAVSKITGAVGKGVAALTFDDEYQKKRRQMLNKQPANFQEGIARSGKGLVMGFVDGVTGVVTKPVSGAREEGVEGFFKGLGKGAIGLVARPTAGVVDFASGSFDAVKRAAGHSDDSQRLRPPRFLHQDNVLRPYCLDKAQGNKMLKEIEKGKYASSDSFEHCEEIVQKREFVLVTNHRLIYASKNDLFGTWAVQWTYLWHEIALIVSSERGVEITLKKEGKKMMGLFSSGDAQRKLILIPQKSRRDNLAEIMESLRKET